MWATGKGLSNVKITSVTSVIIVTGIIVISFILELLSKIIIRAIPSNRARGEPDSLASTY